MLAFSCGKDEDDEESDGGNFSNLGCPDVERETRYSGESSSSDPFDRVNHCDIAESIALAKSRRSSLDCGEDCKNARETTRVSPNSHVSQYRNWCGVTVWVQHYCILKPPEDLN